MGNSESFDLLSISEYKNSTKKKHATHHLNSQFISPSLNSITSFDLNGIFRRLSDDINDFKTIEPIEKTKKKVNSSLKIPLDKIENIPSEKPENIPDTTKDINVEPPTSIDVKEEEISNIDEGIIETETPQPSDEPKDEAAEVEAINKDEKCELTNNEEETDIIPLEETKANYESQHEDIIIKTNTECLIKETLESESDASVISQISTNEKN